MQASKSKRYLRQLKELEKHAKIAKNEGMKLAAESWNKDWQTLISILMSARTRDEVTIPTAAKLFQKYKSLNSISKTKTKDIEKIIRPVNFYKNKSKYILALAKKVKSDYQGKVPKEFEELVKLPGVGRKTANVFLAEKGNPEIGVDTHVSYISNKLGWTKSTNQKKVEEDLKSIFPKRYWGKVNSTLVRFGKKYTSRRKKDLLLKGIKKIK